MRRKRKKAIFCKNFIRERVRHSRLDKLWWLCKKAFTRFYFKTFFHSRILSLSPFYNLLLSFFFSLSPSISFSLSFTLSHSLPHSLPHSFSLYLPLPHSFSLSLPHLRSLTFSLSLILSIFFSTTHRRKPRAIAESFFVRLRCLKPFHNSFEAALVSSNDIALLGLSLVVALQCWTFAQRICFGA